MKKALILFAAITSLSSISAGEVGTSSTSLPTAMNTFALNRIYIDGAAVLVRGGAVGYERVLSPKVTVGPYFAYISPRDPVAIFNEYENQISIAGIRSRLFLSNANKSSFYLMGGAQYASISTRVKATGLFTSDSATSRRKSNSGVGAVAGVGWQAANPSQSIYFNIGLHTMYGAKYKNASRSNVSRGEAEVTETSLGYGAMIELNLGFRI